MNDAREREEVIVAKAKKDPVDVAFQRERALHDARARSDPKRKAKKAPALVPPDRERCQGERREGSFMTLGPRGMARCESRPTVIVTERLPGVDGRRGSMSLCDACLAAFKAHDPRAVDVETIEPEVKPAKRVGARRSRRPRRSRA